MTSLDNQIEELIKERNAFEAENIALKAQVNELKQALCDGSYLLSGLRLDSTTDNIKVKSHHAGNMEVIHKTPEQCLNSIKVSAFEEGFRYSCEVYNGGGSKEVIEVAVDNYKDSLEE